MLSAALPRGVTFVGARIHSDWVEAEYICAGRSVTLRLEHPAQSEHEGVDTRTFRIVAPGTPALDGLVRALARSIQALEGAFAWSHPAGQAERGAMGGACSSLRVPPERRMPDVEELAFRAGIKPALRISCKASEVDDVVRRLEAGGAHVRRGSRVIEGEELALVYVARSGAEAEQLRSVERADDHTLSLGALLGYPACCVAAYDQRARAGTSENDWYRSARAGWVSRPMPRLNALLMVEGRSLLSFDPCRYDCPAAFELASRVADAVREVDSEWLEFAERQLALPIAVDRRGARAHVELEGRIPDGRARIIGAWAPVSPRGDSRDKDRALAERLAGRPVSHEGLADGEAAIVMDFSAGR